MLVGVLPAAQKYPAGHTVMFDAAVLAPQKEPDGHCVQEDDAADE